MENRRRVSVVPHTHWDREWYVPFEEYRTRLGSVLDGVLTTLQNDSRYGHYLLDGQLAAVDDYLALAPHDQDRIVSLITAGRLSIGPWYVLMDEFLASGETLIANLRLGLTRAQALGAKPRIGYLPDMFGHIAQMPQVLALAGLDMPVLYRGVPNSVRATQFVWRGADGTELVTEYLANGYSNGARVPNTGQQLQSAIAGFVAQTNVDVGDSVLWMVGTDHQAIDTTLADRVDEANQYAGQSDFELAIEGLDDYLRQRTINRDALSIVAGELRSSGRANLLSNCVSTHRQVRELVKVSESWIERYAQPLLALAMARDVNEIPFLSAALEDAVKNVVLNSAHDSICACSHDEVVAAVATRYRSAATTARSVASQLVSLVAHPASSATLAVFNPSPFARPMLIEVATDSALGQPMQYTDGLGESTSEDEVLLDLTVSAADVAVVTRDLHTAELLPGVWLQSAELTNVDGEVLGVHAVAGPIENVEFDIESFKQRVRLWAGDAKGTDRHVHLLVTRPQRRTALVLTPPLAPLAVTSVKVFTDTAATTTAALVGPRVIGFQDDRIVVELEGHTYQLGIECQSDAGDTYNFCPVRDETPTLATNWSPIETIESGPLRISVSTTATIRIGAHLDHASGHRSETIEQQVRLTLTTQANRDDVQITVAIDNQLNDMRLRLLITNLSIGSGSVADCVFGPVSRPDTVETGYEHPDPTYPARAWVNSGNTTVCLPYMSEYQVLTQQHTLALTVLRSTGWLSRSGLHNRPSAAGPEVATPSAQQLGPHRVTYALLPPSRSTDLDATYRDAEIHRLDPLVVSRGRSAAPSNLPLVARSNDHIADQAGVAEVKKLLTVGGAQLSTIRIANGAGVEIRIFNPHDHVIDVNIDGIGQVVDLAGEVVAPWIGCSKLGPRKILTVRLEP